MCDRTTLVAVSAVSIAASDLLPTTQDDFGAAELKGLRATRSLEVAATRSSRILMRKTGSRHQMGAASSKWHRIKSKVLCAARISFTP